MRPWDDDDEEDWWFASTAIPLLAATLGPLANVLSIAALVTSWRMCLITGIDNEEDARTCSWNGDESLIGPDLTGHPFADPSWCYNLNIVSLVVGFVGNLFLLFNFTNRIRYIIALPVTILMWYIATAILIGITIGMQIYVPPTRPQQTYTQGFWYAVLAAVMYLICSMLLMINMWGYFLGHYPQHFTLTESQRTLILQTMLFFLWLAGGGAVFARVETLYGDGKFEWSYTNALYFCDVTVLTVGFGDIYCTSNIGRGLVFPFSVGGIIMLGLMISSLTKFASEIGSDKIVNGHLNRSRARTLGRTVTSEIEMEERKVKAIAAGERPVISAPIGPEMDRVSTLHIDRTPTVQIVDDKETWKDHPGHRPGTPMHTLRRAATIVSKPVTRQRTPKLVLLKEEKDRFDAMRRIQRGTSKFKRWYALSMSVTAFGLLWCVGAVVFWAAEQRTQQLSYFEALYFCYVSLLTIGYGDLAPQSNAGRPFFVVWSLIAVPTMTILVSDMGDTVINHFKQATFTLADFTVLPKSGVWRSWLEKHPWILQWIQARKEQKAAKRRLEEGFPAGPDPADDPEPPTIEELAEEKPTEQELAKKLAKAIRATAHDMRAEPNKRYNYEEWVKFTQLIRFSARNPEEVMEEEADEGLIEWDWIGEDSPMMAKEKEPEFVLDRLCESMNRYVRRMATPTPDEQEDLNKRPEHVRRYDDHIITRGRVSVDRQSGSDETRAVSSSLDLGPKNETAAESSTASVPLDGDVEDPHNSKRSEG